MIFLKFVNKNVLSLVLMSLILINIGYLIDFYKDINIDSEVISLLQNMGEFAPAWSQIQM